jgi:FKBP-type peptidyl-prolyl cis-trans isomerase
MKLLRLVFILILTAGMINAQEKKESKKGTEPKTPKSESSVILKTTQDSVSYAIGQNIFTNLKDPSLELNLDIVVKSFQDAIKGTTMLVKDQVVQVMTGFQQKIREKQAAASQAEAEKRKATGAKNKKEGDDFLSANKTKAGVITTESGLQYKVLEKGTGAMPSDSDTVKVDYKGTLIDGREFDNSYKRGEPVEFPVSQVIKGWTEAVKLMHVGDKFELYIPSELAYGATGAGGMIEPNATLIFEVKLLDIKTKAKK